MSSLQRKLSRMNGKNKVKYLNDVRDEAVKIADVALEKIYRKAYDDATEEAFAKILAVSAEIVYNDWGKLTKKETRLQVFVDLFADKVQRIENPSDKQIEVERMLEDCGVTIGRKEDKK